MTSNLRYSWLNKVLFRQGSRRAFKVKAIAGFTEENLPRCHELETLKCQQMPEFSVMSKICSRQRLLPFAVHLIEYLKVLVALLDRVLTLGWRMPLCMLYPWGTPQWSQLVANNLELKHGASVASRHTLQNSNRSWKWQQEGTKALKLTRQYRCSQVPKEMLSQQTGTSPCSQGQCSSSGLPWQGYCWRCWSQLFLPKCTRSYGQTQGSGSLIQPVNIAL